MHFQKSLGIFLAALVLPGLSFAATAREIDAKVDAAMDRFHKEVNVADQLLAKASAVLVIPEVIKGGFIVGGQYGEGTLKVAGKPTVYYNIASASFGLTAGGVMKDVVILFFSAEALENFRSRKGWEAGVDGNIAVWKEGKGGSAEITRMNDPMVAFVVGVKGLLVDASLQGSKFSVINK